MGPLAWILTLFAANGLLLAALIVGAPANRMAGWFLASLIALISLRLGVYILGFAGAYDAWPWLTFLPLDASLAFGPLLWLYVASLTRGAPTPRWRLHLLPGATQLAYFAAAFCLPQPVKWRWYTGPHLHLVEPTALALILPSCAAYLVAAWRRQRAYQRWLDDRFGNREEWRLGWLTVLLLAFAATLAAATGAATWSALVGPIDYFARTPVILACSLLAYVLGLLGWRNAALRLPPEMPAAVHDDSAPGDPGRWRAAYEGWAAQVDAGGWWHDEQATLGVVARRLAVSERTLSRGLREGGDCNFNQFINEFRVAAVQRAILSGDDRDLLTIALACGFNSKASFNRAFRAHAGQAPSQWRAAAQNPPIAAPIAI